jgi:hypothetical protein
MYQAEAAGYPAFASGSCCGAGARQQNLLCLDRGALQLWLNLLFVWYRLLSLACAAVLSAAVQSLTECLST